MLDQHPALFAPPSLLHGGDYNPEQWLRYPGVIDRDFELFAKAGLNSITVGVFSWVSLEPAEGQYEFSWLDDIFERAARRDMRVILATPSGGKPNWLAAQYPEIRRVTWEGQREQQQSRHNHCPTSPVYREKVSAINTRLAQRYGQHPALTLWHVSNEYSGYCYCDLCKGAFRDWLKSRYASLDEVNEAWWSRFWSHTYTEWEQIDCIDWCVSGLVRDWKLFMTHQLRSFIRGEIEPLREHSPHVPVTTNLMPSFEHFNYWDVAKEFDVISWDSYPNWHGTNPDLDETDEGARAAFHHDIFRSMKGGHPFLLMETTPSQVNYNSFSALRRPGLHRLAALQAVAHGADAVCYFQMRKGRGSIEQFHGAVIDHTGRADNRVFREVASLGQTLEKLGPIRGGRTSASVAVIYDWESRWALELATGPQNAQKNYFDTVISFYQPFWRRGIAVDIVHPESDLTGYRLVAAPMIFLTDEKKCENLARYVRDGGTLVATYQTSVVDAHARAHLGGVPGHLRDLFGLWVEEFDTVPKSYGRQVTAVAGACGLSGSYAAHDYLELINPTTAESIAHYAHDFYAGRTAATRHCVGAGQAFYLGARTEAKFQDDLLGFLSRDLGLPRALPGDLPHGVSAHLRSSESGTYLVLLNFTNEARKVALPEGKWRNVDTDVFEAEPLELGAYGSVALVKTK